MVDYTKTINNSLLAVGCGSPLYWGSGIFGIFIWGDGKKIKIIDDKNIDNTIPLNLDDIYKTVDKEISNTMIVTNILYKAVDKYFENSMAVTSVIYDYFIKNIINYEFVTSEHHRIYAHRIETVISVNCDSDFIYMQQSPWYYEYPRPNKNAHLRNPTHWTMVS